VLTANAEEGALDTASAKIQTLNSWQQFIEIVRDGFIRRIPSGGVAVPDRVLYRGHARTDWKLSAPLDRRLVHHVSGEGGKIEYESLRKHNGLEWYDKTCLQVFNQFKHAYRGISDANTNLTDDEYWAVGRHFGLLTPLLDWTLSPYVAAYFAFGERLQHMQYGYHGFTLRGNRENVRIWAMAVEKGIEIPAEFEIVNASPPIDAARQRAQSGLFTRLRSREYFDIESYFGSRGLIENLTAYDMSMDAASHAMRDLQLMNITPRTLFPDLHGAAMEANIDTSKLHLTTLIYDQKLR
jgi:hypothetical protein